MTSARLPLITQHWFREGPIQPAGYWICGFPECGEHRADHAQAEGQWLAPAHTFTPQRIAPSRCRTCGYHRLHTCHLSWRWDAYQVAAKPCAGPRKW